MCGICGIVNASGDPRRYAATVGHITEDLERRGPDSAGTWSAEHGQASLGFRRLAIIDPTPAGAQPMWSRSGDAVLVFNGEIYNHRDIGRELEQHGTRFRSTSDTEVLLEGLRRWGPDLLPRLRGMFALAFFRPESRTILLARDHAGIKPLFIAHQPGGNGLAFSSRYDSLFRTGWLDPDAFDLSALADYVKRRHVGRATGLHRHTGQVGPGEWLTADPSGITERVTWWRLEQGDDAPLTGAEATEALTEAVERSVRRHLVSDVPVGVFLSGGIDSPLVAGMATSGAGRRLEGFTIGYPDWDLDESEAAAMMAEPLGIDHRIRSVTAPPDDIIESVTAAQDEPLNDWSIIPTMLVSEAARASVTVALSGDGGDELFFGYIRSWSVTGATRLWSLPVTARRAIMKARGMLGLATTGSIAHRDPTAYYDAMQASSGPRLLDEVAPGLIGHWDDLRPAGHNGPLTRRALAEFSRRREFEIQLPRVLRKVDQASMHHSLEVRVPLLDPDVIATALRIDPGWTLTQSGTKPVLRSMLRCRLGFDPPDRKLGFGAPMARWMTHQLREPIGDALAGEIGPPGVFDGARVQQLWAEQVAGRADHRTLLWGLAALAWWQRRVHTMTPTRTEW